MIPVRRAVLLLASALPLAAQSAPRDLAPVDMFRLEFLMSMDVEDPKGWLDAGHYLLFDPGRPAPQGQRSWFAVDARTGKREQIVDRKAVAAALAAAGVPAEATSAIDDADHWTWNQDHSAFVVAAGGDLFLGRRDGAVTRLTDTPGAEEEIVQFAPDGQHLGFVRAHNLYVVPAAGGPEVAITTQGNDDLFFGKLDWVYQEEVFGRGDFRAFWWSPDSRHLALMKLDESPVQEFTLVSDTPARPEIEKVHYPKAGEANPKVWLGVADCAGGSVRWFDVAAYPDADRLIVRATWAPDGKEVFFQVQNREQTWLDMLAGDVATGAVRKVFHEDSDCWIEPGPEPLFVRGGAEFLWPSERDGTRHLYRYARDGKELGRLTQGDWQLVKVVAVDEPHGVVWFLRDTAWPPTRHLCTVPLAGGEVTAVTSGRGTHEVTMAPGNELFLDSCSTIESPAALTLRDRGGREVRVVGAPRTELLQPFGLTAPEFAQAPARDGYAMTAMVIKPRGFEAGKRYPVLQFTYSGPHTPRVRDEWQSRDYLWHQLLAQHGYLVFGCDNRSASGAGRKYAKACWHDFGHSELRDLEDGVDWLVAQGAADPARIGIWGWSYGGYQTLFDLTHSDKWKCGIAVNPVTDWRNYDTIYTERYLGLPTTNAAGYDGSSVVESAKDLHGSLLLICSAMDDNVHMQNSLQFLYALQMAGKDCDFMVYPRVRHGIESLQQQLHLFRRLRHFLQQHL